MSQALAIGIGARHARDRDEADWFALRASRTDAPVNDALQYATTPRFDPHDALISAFGREVSAYRCAVAPGSMAGPRKGLNG